MQDQSYKKDNNALADKIRKEELLLSIALSEYKQVIFDIDDLVISDYMRQDSAQSLLAPGMLLSLIHIWWMRFVVNSSVLCIIPIRSSHFMPMWMASLIRKRKCR